LELHVYKLSSKSTQRSSYLLNQSNFYRLFNDGVSISRNDSLYSAQWEVKMTVNGGTNLEEDIVAYFKVLVQHLTE